MSESTSVPKLVWLHILKEGGRWSTSDIRKATNEDGTLISQAVKDMSDNGYLIRYDRKAFGEALAYGVTAACKVPRGVTIADLLECDLIPLAEGASHA